MTRDVFGRRRLGAVLVAAALFGSFGSLGSAVQAEQAVPVPAALDFAIERNNEQVGFHRIGFSRDDGRFVVDTEVSVRVVVMFVTVYRFTHKAREVWAGGRLVALDAETDDDGTPHRLSVHADGDVLRVTHNGAPSTVAAGLTPTSLWNKAMAERTVLLGTLRGDAMPTQVTRLGTETIPGPDGQVEADGFLVDASPDYKRWVWYDHAGRVVKVRLLGRDGSTVSYRLR